MSLSLDQYKSLLHVKESLFLKKREEAFDELRRVLKEIPLDADVNWFGCNVIDVADCETLVQFPPKVREQVRLEELHEPEQARHVPGK